MRPAHTARVAWSVFAIIVWQLAGAAHLLAASSETAGTRQPGLIATATDGTRTVSFVALTPNATLSSTQSIHPQLKPEFQAEWKGTILIVRGGRYSFSMNAAVHVDGVETQGKPVSLTGGEHDLRIVVQRRPAADVRLQLQWESEFFPREPVPAAVLGHKEVPAEVRRSELLARGRVLWEDLNCVACHQAKDSLVIRRRGPNLEFIGSRIKTEWLAHWLENPHAVNPSATMPVLLNSAQDRADVVTYLASLKRDALDLPYHTKAERQRQGAELYQQTGCAGCHGEGASQLKGLGSKFLFEALARYLANPRATRMEGLMPDFHLDPTQGRALADYLLQSRLPALETPAPDGDSKRGRNLVAVSGCTACHTVVDNDGRLPNQLKAPAMADLKPQRGCLSATPGGKSMRYSLKPEDRAALTAYLGSPDVSEAPVQDFQRTINRLQCVACHEWNGPSRLVRDANQIPPALTDAGNKLRASWLKQVLLEGKAVRPWMDLKMPQFADRDVTPLTDLFAAQAGAEAGEGEVIANPSLDSIRAGIKLIGQNEGGLACINCHDFRGGKSAGQMRGPDMTEMYARIRTDWLKRWLHDPSRIQPGTAMPSFFTDLPAAQADTMIKHIGDALWTGADMPVPDGLSVSAKEYLVLAKQEPVVMRTFMPDSSWRSIAVGLVEGQNYCFDAQLCRFRYAWGGDFLDARSVWTDRGGGTPKLLGTKYYTAPDDLPLRFGDGLTVPKVRFRGYTLENKVPRFRYELDGVTVRESVYSLPGGAGLVRSFEIDRPGADVWFVAGASTEADVTCSGGSMDQGKIRFPAASTVRFDIRIRPR